MPFSLSLQSRSLSLFHSLICCFKIVLESISHSNQSLRLFHLSYLDIHLFPPVKFSFSNFSILHDHALDLLSSPNLIVELLLLLWLSLHSPQQLSFFVIILKLDNFLFLRSHHLTSATLPICFRKLIHFLSLSNLCYLLSSCAWIEFSRSLSWLCQTSCPNCSGDSCKGLKTAFNTLVWSCE